MIKNINVRKTRKNFNSKICIFQFFAFFMVFLYRQNREKPDVSLIKQRIITIRATTTRVRIINCSNKEITGKRM